MDAKEEDNCSCFNLEEYKKDFRLFSKLQEKRRNIAADIRFIKLCLSKNVTPNFVKKIVKFDNNSSL